MGYMEFMVIATLAVILRRPAGFVLRMLAWVAVVVALALMALSVATGVPVPTGFLVVTLGSVWSLRWAGRRRAARRSGVVFA